MIAKSAPIVVRRATESDFPAIARIQQRCPEAAQWPLGDYSGFETLLAVVDRLPAGFCAWRQVSPDEAELLNLAVDPEWRRRGVAAALLAKLQSVASGDLFLEVAEPNSAAIELYAKSGWCRIGLRKGYYEAGRVNGIVMKKRSC